MNAEPIVDVVKAEVCYAAVAYDDAPPDYKWVPHDISMHGQGMLSWNPAEQQCRGCRGWCCAGFSVGREIFEPIPEADIAKVPPEAVYNKMFAMKNFYRLYDDAYDGLHGSVACSCRQYDRVTGKCKDHEHRPVICRQFLCGYTWKFRKTPMASQFRWQAAMLHNDNLSTNEIQRRG